LTRKRAAARGSILRPLPRRLRGPRGATAAELAPLFLEPFQQAQRDGLFPDEIDIARPARVGQSLVAEGIRRWAANNCTGLLAEPLGPEIAALLGGLCQRR
jgi:hypothetical protein